MANAPDNAPYILLQAPFTDLPVARIINADPSTSGLLLNGVSTGIHEIIPNGKLQSLLNAANISAPGFLWNAGNSTNTAIFTSDGSVQINNPDGQAGNPTFSVTPGTYLGRIQTAINGRIVNFSSDFAIIGSDQANVELVDNPSDNRMDLTFSTDLTPTTIQSFGITSPSGTLAITGTNPITTTGTITLNVANTSTLSISSGGTGQTTAQAAFDALSPGTTTGDLIVYNNGNIRLPIGPEGSTLQLGSSPLPFWSTTTFSAPVAMGTAILQYNTSVQVLNSNVTANSKIIVGWYISYSGFGPYDPLTVTIQPGTGFTITSASHPFPAGGPVIYAIISY